MDNRFIEAMKFRFATKEFDGREIPDRDFEAILEAGRLSPSSFGYEPWRFVVIQNKSLREKLKSFTWGALRQMDSASHFVMILARKAKGMKYGSSYIEHIEKDIHKLPDDIFKMKGEFYEKFQKEDFGILQNDRAMFDWASKQTYIALANMLTAAAYMKIDSCPVEGFDMKQADKFLSDELGIDTDEFGISVMALFGYRKEEGKREKTRQELNDIVSWFR